MDNPEPNTPEVLTDKLVITLEDLLAERGATREQVCGTVLGVPTKVAVGGSLPDGLPNVKDSSWIGATPARLLSKKLGVPVEIANDGNLAAIAAAYEYANTSNLAFEQVTVNAIGVGSGLGGGMCRRGEIIFGEFFGAKESGHFTAGIHDILFDFAETSHCLFDGAALSVQELQMFTLADDGRSLHCGCRRRGCLEVYSCKNGLGKIYRRARALGHAAKINGQTIENENLLMAAACQDDPLASLLLNLNAYVLGVGAGMIATQDNPHAVVAYGGAFESAHLLKYTSEEQRRAFFARYWKIAHQSYLDNVSFPSTASEVEFVKSNLGDALPAFGAALYAHQKFS